MRKERAIEAMVAYVTRGDLLGAYRFYVEHRVSYATYEQAIRKGRAIRKHFGISTK